MEPDGITTYEIDLECDASAPQTVRQWLQTLPIESRGELALLTHEIVVNAIAHTDTQKLWLTLLVCPDVIHVQVANEGSTKPHVVDPEPFAESGRGLRWVDAMSAAWGVGCTTATHVWFQVPRPDVASGSGGAEPAVVPAV